MLIFAKVCTVRSFFCTFFCSVSYITNKLTFILIFIVNCYIFHFSNIRSNTANIICAILCIANFRLQTSWQVKFLSLLSFCKLYWIIVYNRTIITSCVGSPRSVNANRRIKSFLACVYWCFINSCASILII